MLGIRNTISISGLTISYIEYNPGSPVTILFLHGWGGSAESFQDLWKACVSAGGNNVRLIAIDFPGFGESPPPQRAWNVTDYTDCVIAFMNALHLQTVDIVSHSFGGRVTTVLATTYPERVERIVYIAAAGIRHYSSTRETIAGFSGVLKRIFSFPLFRPFFPVVKKIGYRIIGSQDYTKTAGVMKETFQKVVEEDLTQRIDHISQRTLLFWGKQDSYVPVADAYYMQEHIEHSELTVFDDGRHGIHKTHAEFIAKQLVSFLL